MAELNAMTVKGDRGSGGSRQYGATTLNQARASAALHRGRLPPGALQGLDVLEKSNRAVLLHEAAQHGPIFKVVAYEKLWVCVVGLEQARRLTKSHGDAIRPVTMNLESLVTGGFMRQMTGDFHRTYRRRLGGALGQLNLNAHTVTLERIVAEHLARFAAGTDQNSCADAYIDCLHSLVTDVLLHILFGAEPGTQFHAELVDAYDELGGDGLAWTLGDKQSRAFTEISQLLRNRCEQLSAHSPGAFGGVMRHIETATGSDDPALDDTMLGNLIYMVEMGRDDVTVLFRWLTKYACDHPEFVARILPGVKDRSPNPLTRAFVSETLRTDQSYRLLRMTTKNIKFDGHFIPKNSMIRICMWESHRSPKTFDHAFEFDADRFVDTGYSADEFSPFGIDQHQCPFAGVSMALSEAFLRELLGHYQLSALSDGDPHRGAYHWEAAPEFAPRLEPSGPSSDQPARRIDPT